MVFVSALCWLFVVFYYCSAPLPVADTVLSTLAQLWPQQSRKCSVVAFSFVCLWSVLPPRQQSDTQSVSSSKQTVRHAPFECNCSSLSFSPAWFFPFFSGWSFLCQSRSPKGCANVFAAFLGGGNCTGTEPQYWQSTTHTKMHTLCILLSVFVVAGNWWPVHFWTDSSPNKRLLRPDTRLLFLCIGTSLIAPWSDTAVAPPTVFVCLQIGCSCRHPVRLVQSDTSALKLHQWWHNWHAWRCYVSARWIEVSLLLLLTLMLWFTDAICQLISRFAVASSLSLYTLPRQSYNVGAW